MSEIPPSAFLPCEVSLPGGVLVLAPLRRFGLAAPDPRRAASALLLLRGHPEAFARLRRDWLRLDLGGDVYRLSPQQMSSALEAAVSAGRLGAAFYPYVIKPVAVLSADFSQPGPQPAPAPLAVCDMSRDERIGAMLKIVPTYLKGSLKEAFLQLITPTAIGIMVGSLVALLVGHAFGYGEVVDAALAAVAYMAAGLAGVAALYDMVAAVWDSSKAQTDTELDAAAHRFADALAVLDVTILLFLIARFRSRSRAASRKPPANEKTVGDAKSDGGPKSGGTKEAGSNPTGSNQLTPPAQPRPTTGGGTTGPDPNLAKANPVGSALKDDVNHRAATFMRDEAAANGTHFNIVGGDGVTRALTQIPGTLNGVAGRFEYIVDPAGNLTHQMFVPGGAINGIPIKP